MKVECVKDKLKEGVAIAERVSGRNLTLPILSAILLETGNKVLIIKSTNLEVGVEIEIPAKIDEAGSVTVSASILNNFLANLNKEIKVELTTINDNLQIITENTSTLIKSLNTEDFPIIPKINQDNGFSINSALLAEGLKAVAFAAALSDIKPEISSVYIYGKDNELFFVATDSFRLVEKKINIDNKIKDPISLIVPLKSVTEIIRTIEGLYTNLMVSFNKNQLAINTDNLYLTLRIIDGAYPDYKQIIPTSFNTELNLKKEELSNILKLSNIFTDKFNQIDIEIKPKSNTLEINSHNQEVGENKFSIITKIKGEPLAISFNAKYLIDCLPSIESGDVNLRFTDKNHPLLISGTGEDSFSYIVMPINK
ncbi:MAG: DNA polymerase III subunit beta [Candidatus Paceibacterota bacterium]|jgi:DNA polymerase-3 subunit beta